MEYEYLHILFNMYMLINFKFKFKMIFFSKIKKKIKKYYIPIIVLFLVIYYSILRLCRQF